MSSDAVEVRGAEVISQQMHETSHLGDVKSEPRAGGSAEHSSPLAVGIPFLSLADLHNLSEEDTGFIVDDLLPIAGSSILYAKPKKGKSILARQLAVSVSQGIPFLGRECKQGAVLYLPLEEKVSELISHFALLGANSGDPIGILTDSRGHSKQDFLSEIRRRKPTLVIIDTLPKFLHLPKMNDYGQVNEALRWMHDAARETGAHFMAVMHAKKGKEEDSMDNLLGSTAFAGGVDTLIALTDSKNSRMISTVQRYGDAMEETLLHFDPATKSLSLGLALREEAAEARRVMNEDLAHRVTMFIAQHPGCTEPELLTSTRGKRETVKLTLRSLLSSCIRREGTGNSGSPYRYFGDLPIEA